MAKIRSPLLRWIAVLSLMVGLAIWLEACGAAATPEPPQDTVFAPIESVNLEYGAGASAQSFLVIVSGLPDGCTKFEKYTFSRSGDTFQVAVTNQRPSDPNLACTQIYGMVTTRIPLGQDLEACKFYTAVVNGKSYQVQAIGLAVQCSAEPPMSSVPAPIESVNLEYGTGSPAQSFLVIVSGLPGGCAKFEKYVFSRSGETFQVTVTNQMPSDPNVACTKIYGYVTTRIPLGLDIEACKVYTAVVNGKSYQVQAIGPTIRCSAPPSTSSIPTPKPGEVELALKVGQSQRVNDTELTLTLVEIAGDSRCPSDVVCVWAGEATVVVRAALGGETSTFKLVLGACAEGGAKAKVGEYQVSLVKLDPYPVSAKPILPTDYIATVRVSSA